MKAVEFTTTISSAGEIRLTGVPFTAGTEVDVWVSPKRVSPAEFAAQWNQICEQLRNLPEVQGLDDAAIQDEVAQHRAGR